MGMLSQLVDTWRARHEVHTAFCSFCRKVPRRDGDDYCSDECAEKDAWAQANGM